VQNLPNPPARRFCTSPDRAKAADATRSVPPDRRERTERTQRSDFSSELDIFEYVTIWFSSKPSDDRTASGPLRAPDQPPVGGHPTAGVPGADLGVIPDPRYMSQNNFGGLSKSRGGLGGAASDRDRQCGSTGAVTQSPRSIQRSQPPGSRGTAFPGRGCCRPPAGRRCHGPSRG
jgi:hypothetical protein